MARAASEVIALSDNGASEYAIVIAEDAIVAERTAAAELQSHIEAVTGATLPIREEAADAKLIVVGPSARFCAAFPEVDLGALKHDGIVMKTKGDAVYLAGGRPRGTLYAVYTFLEDVVGCRWWSSTERFVPDRPTLTIPALDVVYTPRLLYREAFYRDAFDGVFAARCKCNGHFEQIPEEYGGHYSILGWCHTFNQLLPPHRYFKDHPEWYSEIDGERVAERSQLCLTNEEMPAEFIKQALEWLRKSPNAGMISIAQNDGRGRCRCAKCRALEDHEGSASGPILHFVNAVAEEIEKEFPDVLVETLAYVYSRHPPKHVRPRGNVVVRLCSIECSYCQPLATGEQNETFRRDIEGWSAIAPQLYIWNYVTNFSSYILPHPNLRVLAPNIRFFVEHNAISLFEQGDSTCSCSDFPELRAWLLAHLMWDPSRDAQALITEFLQGYYGAAAGPLEAYINLIHDAVEASGAYLRCYMSDTSSWLGSDDLERATALFDEAERRVAGDAARFTRVRRARMPLDHVWLNRYHALKRLAKAEGRPFSGPEAPKAFSEEFIRRAHEFDVGNYREGHPFAEYEPRLRARFGPPGRAPTRCEGLADDDWVDIQDGEFFLHNYGRWVLTVEDKRASNGSAARMPGDHNEWAVQYRMSADLAALGPLHCYVVVRCQAKAKAGDAFQIGIHDRDARKGVVAETIPLERCADGAYHEYDLGVHALSSGMQFWVAPMENPDEVRAVFVDRIYCVREGQGER